MAKIRQVKLTNFRSYTSLDLSTTADIIALIAPNGAGKTNILEAISLFGGGKGIRSADPTELPSQGMANNGWGVNITLEAGTNLGTGVPSGSARRGFKVNYNPVKSATSFAEYLKLISIVPTMDYILIGSAANRRKYYDQICTLFKPSHQQLLIDFDHLQHERLKLLKQYKSHADSLWLDKLETQISALGAAIAEQRIATMQALHPFSYSGDHNFPATRITITGPIEEQVLAGNTTEDIRLYYVSQLTNNRELDGITGRTNFGIHRYDIMLEYIDKSRPGSQCSTGEQKALILRLTIAQVQAIVEITKTTPILLLDDIAAHLDHQRYENLLACLSELKVQIWITATESFSNFATPDTKIEKYTIQGGKVKELG